MDPRCPTDGVRLILEARSEVELRPTGVSMLPNIFPGDRVTLRPAGRLQLGDVVLTEGDRPRLHRVVALDRARGVLVTRGDTAACVDPEVALDAVVGVVSRITPHWPARLRFVAARAATALRRRGGRLAGSVINVMFSFKPR